ncbi:MAG: hypothetical protein ACOCR1_02015 [Planctomycetota bacterium]
MENTRQILKLEPASVLKPWGITHGEVRESTGIQVGLGELWLASAQTGPGNYASEISNPDLEQNLAELLFDLSEKGESALISVLGEYAVRVLTETPHRGKTEAWHVRKAEGRVGFAAGPRTENQCRELEELLTGPGLSARIEDWSPEVRDLFGLIQPVQEGEIYMVPAGTLHTMFGIGEDSTLIVDEIQQGYGTSWLPTLSKILMVQDDLLSVQVHPSDSTVAAAARGELDIDQDLESNPTVRVYDFGRRPGEYPELGFQLADPGEGLRLVNPVAIQPTSGVDYRIMVANESFVKATIDLEAGVRWKWDRDAGTYHVLHCSQGSVSLTAGGDEISLQRGETVFVPAALEDELVLETREGGQLSDDCMCSPAELKGYLAEHGAEKTAIEGLFSPPKWYDSRG